VDSTQRNVLGAFGGVLILAAFAWAGLFPKGHDAMRVVPAVGVGLVGLALVVVAFVSHERSQATIPREPPDTPGGGPMVIARELVNNGIIAHTVNKPVPPAVATTDSRPPGIGAA
jgi:hypothetical protein